MDMIWTHIGVNITLLFVCDSEQGNTKTKQTNVFYSTKITIMENHGLTLSMSPESLPEEKFVEKHYTWMEVNTREPGTVSFKTPVFCKDHVILFMSSIAKCSRPIIGRYYVFHGIQT